MTVAVPFTRTLAYVLREQLQRPGLTLQLGTVTAIPDSTHVTVDFGAGTATIARLPSYTPTVGEPAYCLAAQTLLLAIGAVGGQGGGGGGPYQLLAEKDQPGGYVGLDANRGASLGRLTVNQGGAGGPILLWSDGRIYFGAASDTTLYRFGANFLASNGHFWTGWGAAPGAAAVAVVASGDSHPRVSMQNNSAIYFGPGTGGTDTTLYRLAGGILKTDGRFDVGTRLTVGLDNIGRIWFGSSDDTSLYRGGAADLRTDGVFSVRGTAPGAASGQTGLGLQVVGLGLRGVAVGPPDSGGAGLRTLVVGN